MISVICAYNDDRILQNVLLAGLSEQKAVFELITIDNRRNRFESAAEALNYGGKRATGDYLLFVHQDVELCSDSWLGSTEDILDGLPNLGVAGVAGVSESGSTLLERYRNNIKVGPEAATWGNPIQEPELVQTLDECLVIIPKSVFDIIQFDEAVCKHWHLYAADYCLSIKVKGFDVYAIPKLVYHGIKTASRTYVSSRDEYYDTLRPLINKHKNKYKWIHTSCGSWNTHYPLVLQIALVKTGVLRRLKLPSRITAWFYR
jgi:Glycosyltransferase like family